MRHATPTKRNPQVRHLSWDRAVFCLALIICAPLASAQADGGQYNDLGAVQDANKKKGIGVVKTSEEVVHGGEVAPVDLNKVKVSDFADNELEMPYYLVNFHRVANGVPLTGERRGWIEVSVWRGNSNQRTYNARVLESQLSLAYFYCAKRPWNTYYGDPAVRARLEAMLERWCNMQEPGGKFSEYAEGRWGLAPTAFATKFTGATLRYLADGPPIDPALHQRVKDCQRKAIMAVFTDPDLWEHGQSYSNQWTNVYAGALQWLALNPGDKEIHDKLLAKMKEAATELQSPAGYFYERDGPDWGYNMSTHQSNLHVAWHFARGTAFEPLVVDEMTRFYDWVTWNAVIEPDGSGYALNRAIETRQRKPWIHVAYDPGANNNSEIPGAEKVEMARAFLPNSEQVAATQARMRAELEASWPNMPRLEPGNFRGFTPYAFLHQDLVHWYPTPEQQKAAREKLPYLKSGSFAHLRADNRMDSYYLFVRRPNYYAAFNGGEQISDQQRLGLGLVWTPEFGAIMQNQTGGRNASSWGTSVGESTTPVEAGNTTATVTVAGAPVDATPGARDLDDGDVSVSYPVGSQGKKSIRFEPDGIHVDIETAGTFTETVPVMVKEGDSLAADGNRVVLTRGGKPAMTIQFENAAKVEIGDPGRERIGPYQVRIVRLQGDGSLKYAMAIGN